MSEIKCKTKVQLLNSEIHLFLFTNAKKKTTKKYNKSQGFIIMEIIITRDGRSVSMNHDFKISFITNIRFHKELLDKCVNTH